MWCWRCAEIRDGNGLSVCWLEGVYSVALLLASRSWLGGVLQVAQVEASYLWLNVRGFTRLAICIHPSLWHLWDGIPTYVCILGPRAERTLLCCRALWAQQVAKTLLRLRRSTGMSDAFGAVETQALTGDGYLKALCPSLHFDIPHVAASSWVISLLLFSSGAGHV